ncbi:MAG: hypothetical protein K8T10_19600 [Candidatus Eremiobacteraeota bacterium]|nr:hypothetical protein [Candidatus Eremiobacteraeota bacterium]
MEIRDSGARINIGGGINTGKRIKDEKSVKTKSDPVALCSKSEETMPESVETQKLSKTAQEMKSAMKYFPDSEAKEAIEYFSKNGMENGTEAGFFKKILFFHHKIKDSGKVLERLKKGKPVYIENERNGHSRVDNLDTLQVLDSLKGRGKNTILPDNQFDALKFLEKGVDENDGFYNPGFWGEKKVNSFDAYNALRTGEEIQVNIGEQSDLKAFSPADLTEANALYGEGENTILPQDQFQALKNLEHGEKEKDGLYVDGESVNAYDALQRLQEGENVGINVGSKSNLIAKDTGDLAEANAFYGQGENTIMPDKDFQLFKYFEKGKDPDDGFLIEGKKANAYEALQALQSGESVSINIGYVEGMVVRTTQDMAELDAFYGSGKNTILPENQFDSMKSFDQLGAYRTPGGRKINAYQSLQEMQGGSIAYIKYLGFIERARTPEDIHELDALEGKGVNDILPKDQYDNLQAIKPYLCESGSPTSLAISSYGALQKFQDGTPVHYRMEGGDFDELMSGKAGNINDLPDALTKLANQQEYDKYSFSFPEYEDKTAKEMKKTPDILKKDVQEAKSNIDKSKNDINDSKGNIDKAESDITRGKRDLRDAERDLLYAESMDDEVWEYGYDYGYNYSTGKYEYHFGQHQVENEEKVEEIRQAESDISDAERRIRRAKSQLSNAESDLESAKKRLEAGELRLSSGESIEQLFPSLRSLIESLDEDKFASQKDELQAKLSEMGEIAKPCGEEIQKNFSKYLKLLNVMESRPGRPDGWIPPEPRME